MKPVKIDIMLRGRFVFTLSYTPAGGGIIDLAEVYKEIETRRPYLKGQPYRIEF